MLNEKEEITLQIFFDGIQAHIKEMKMYMNNEIEGDTISKKDVERFLNDVMLEVTETINDITLLKDRN